MKAINIIIILASVFCANGTWAAIGSRNAICNNIVSTYASVSIADSIKNGRSSNSMPVESRDTGNYGMLVQISKDKLSYAQTGIYFNANASDTYWQIEDAAVVNGGNPQVYFSSYTSDNVQVCINTMSDYAKGKKIRLYVNAVCSGAYSLSLAKLMAMDTAEYSVDLVDRLKNDSVDIVHNAYPFTIALSDSDSFGGNRFVMDIQHKPVAPYKLSTFSGQKVTEGVEIDWKGTNAGNFTGYVLQRLNNAGGYDSIYSVQSNPSISIYHFMDNHPVMGNNVYRLEQNGISGAITYSAPITIGYNSNAANSLMNVYPNPATAALTVSFPSASMNTVTYVANIYDLAGVRIQHQVVSGNSWTNDVSTFQNGFYIIQVTDRSGNFIGQTKFIKRN